MAVRMRCHAVDRHVLVEICHCTPDHASKALLVDIEGHVKLLR